jgi:hypothetical protein
MKTASILITLVITPLLISSCSNRADNLKEQGYSTVYIKGDTDGCMSGKAAAKGLSANKNKDVTLFIESKEYQTSWFTAFKECQKEETAKINKKILNDNIKEQSWQRGHGPSKPPVR